MWPFPKKIKEKESHHIAKRVIAGLIIGGAIGSIVGKKLMEQHEDDDERQKKKDDGR